MLGIARQFQEAYLLIKDEDLPNLEEGLCPARLVSLNDHFVSAPHTFANLIRNGWWDRAHLSDAQVRTLVQGLPVHTPGLDEDWLPWLRDWALPYEQPPQPPMDERTLDVPELRAWRASAYGSEEDAVFEAGSLRAIAHRSERELLVVRGKDLPELKGYVWARVLDRVNRWVSYPTSLSMMLYGGQWAPIDLDDAAVRALLPGLEVYGPEMDAKWYHRERSAGEE